ncbi:NAD dependent epimerase/dehydratase family protein [Corynebacterium capitovis DSM 44611]|uniref:NAD-dependent epimerase/dehydratase family protein n=1 Tax=Corynebacterium capitovis TaxID=131081 RepID=UPI00038078A3|nr:NAD-dependent epimerase/dehydratase family protein [Corynebacterium capitovis]WKD56993.1 NAD dependent epimerase/dehydratase family protein [Corynebacterium capitovis DSM 44611]
MKIAVTGASGNVGTAVLRALKQDDQVTEIVGVSRRVPSTSVEPYAGCEWHSIDVGAASRPQESVAALSEAFAGADCVIHLAWIIFPNHDRELLRRVNVEGTRRVLDAAVAAGVKHVVVASSIGAYSPDPARAEVSSPSDNPPLRGEDFEARGINGSHYSEDKGAVEAMLDEFEAAHPDITVARLRPGLIFQSDAASAIKRFFLGSWVPGKLLDAGALPTLPLPKGVRAQAVHSDDIGQAYRLAAVTGASGAFNICADDVLGPQELADILDHGKFVELPPALVRGAVAAAHASGAIAADAGWVDMAMGVPMMDNSRAKDVLGWAPTRSAKDAVAEVLKAMSEGAGFDSPSLWAEDKAETAFAAIGGSVQDALEQARTGSEITERIDTGLLRHLLANHLAGGRTAVERLDMMTLNYQDTPVFPQIAEAARDIRADRDFLELLAESFGMGPKAYQEAAAWAGEKIARLKPNGRVTERSPMALLLEAELLRSAVVGKIGLWEVLRDNASDLGLNAAFFDTLVDSAQSQLDLLNEVHAHASATALRTDAETYRS